jgi:hypothetical protein
MLGSQLEVGDVFAVNGDKFTVISIEPSTTNPDSRKVRFVSERSGREYLRLIYNIDQLRVVV